MLLGLLGVSLLRNLLTSKGTIRAGEGTIRADLRIFRASQIFYYVSSFTNFEKQKYLSK